MGPQRGATHSLIVCPAGKGASPGQWGTTCLSPQESLLVETSLGAAPIHLQIYPGDETRVPEPQTWKFPLAGRAESWAEESSWGGLSSREVKSLPGSTHLQTDLNQEVPPDPSQPLSPSATGPALQRAGQTHRPAWLLQELRKT